MMHCLYLHNTIVVKSLVIERLQGQEATSDSEFEEEKLNLVVEEYGLRSVLLCHVTTYRWMLYLGF